MAEFDADHPNDADVSPDDVVSLIELYFSLDEPLERDACLDDLARSDLPLVTEFFQAVLQHDEDEYIRIEVAAELARRGDPRGRAALDAVLEEPDADGLFVCALASLVKLDGQTLYPRLVELWKNGGLSAEHTVEVLAAMESVDPKRAMDDFVQAISEISAADEFFEEQFETMALAFVRQEHRVALATVEDLGKRLSRFDIPDEEQRELIELVEEACALLR